MRGLFFALDRYPGYVCSDYEAPLSCLEQMKLISLVFDLIDYPSLRNNYDTMKPSVVVDLTDDWNDFLKDSSPPGSETERNERRQAFSDLHGWVLWSLNNWVNLDFYVYPGPTSPPAPDPERWYWFGDHETYHPECDLSDNIVGTEISTVYSLIDGVPAVPSNGRIISLNASSYPFQGKLWVGADEADAQHWEGKIDDITNCGYVRSVVAYLRAMDNQTIDDTFESPSNSATCNLQQWRNIDTSTVPNLWSDKWGLISNSFEPTGSPFFLRRHRPDNPSKNTLSFSIDCNKFKSGKQYAYVLISLDKLEEKLHLMSKYRRSGESNACYPHIQEELSLKEVFDNLTLHKPNDDPVDAASPIVAPVSPDYAQLPSSGTKDVPAVDLTYTDPEDPTKTKSMSDFILIIKPVSEFEPWIWDIVPLTGS